MSETTTPPAVPAMTLDQMVGKYVALRDKKAVVADEQKRAMAPFNVAMDTLEGWILAKLNEIGADSVKTQHGTAYKTTSTSCKVMEWSATLAFIREHEAWDLLEARVSKTAVAAIMEDTKQPVPGVSVTREIAVNVRRT